MGGSNVTKAYKHWRPHLTHREMCALVFMANTALDADTPPVYFGGWEAVAGAVGLDVQGNPGSAKRNTLKVLGKLSTSGAVTSSGSAYAGVRAEYALNLDPEHHYQPVTRGRNVQWEAVPQATKTVTHPGQAPTGMDTPHGHPPTTKTVTHMDDPNGPEWIPHTVTPMSTEEPQRGISEKKTAAPPSPASPGPVSGFRNAAEDQSIEDSRNAQLAALRARYAEDWEPAATGTDGPPF